MGPWRTALRAILGLLLGVIARLWLWTLRVEVRADPGLNEAEGVPWVLSFFHGTQWPLLAWKRRRGTVVLVSFSRDGALQARALSTLGLVVVRGSSSRGGARGLAALVRVMRSRGLDAAFAVDGPKGPYGEAKGGAIVAARASSALIVPMGSAAERGVTLARAWDRFVLAWPFTRVAVVLGAPIDPTAIDPASVSGRQALGRAIARANDEARALLYGTEPAASGTLAGVEKAR